MSLSSYLLSDLNVFFSLDEFAVSRAVNGKDMTVIIDNDLIKEIIGTFKDPEGLYSFDVCFLVRASEYGEKPVPEQMITFGDDKYLVVSAVDCAGMYLITLRGIGS
jgi:hypothetical protein